MKIDVVEADIDPDIRISCHGVAVDQNYFWNYDMASCPQGKVQLLSAGGIPQYGIFKQGDKFWSAWAALPKTISLKDRLKCVKK